MSPSSVIRILTLGFEVGLYIWIHRHWRVLDLSWDSALTWYAALLGVDFAYYWAHRASHGKPGLYCTYVTFRFGLLLNLSNVPLSVDIL
jgi:sterol desaturase/sphingolipid hydroxylase (fatty acid hydroxylase superfamily)